MAHWTTLTRHTDERTTLGRQNASGVGQNTWETTADTHTERRSLRVPCNQEEKAHLIFLLREILLRHDVSEAAHRGLAGKRISSSHGRDLRRQACGKSQASWTRSC